MSHVSKESYDPLTDLLGEELESVDSLLLARLRSEVPLVSEIANYLVSSGGKRFRAMIAIAAARMCGCFEKSHTSLAAAIELVHAATLLHDDVIDDGQLRRYKIAAHRIWGNKASILVGDFLLGQAFQIMVEVGSIEALGVVSGAAMNIVEGEMLQLTGSNKVSLTEPEYMSIIRAKTAALFSAAGEVGAIIADVSLEKREALKDYGTNLGIAYQLIDDATDYSSSSCDTEGCTDFSEGKVTFPVILAYDRGSSEEREFWRRCIQRRDVTPEDREQAIFYLHRSLSLKDTVRRAEEYGVVAKDALYCFEDGVHKRALHDVVVRSIDSASERLFSIS